MREHERFEIICALAANGQATMQELRDLHVHAAQCADCKSRMREMGQISAQALLPCGVKKHRRRLPRGMEERFAVRARAEGVPLQMPRSGLFQSSDAVFWQWGGIAAAVVLAILVAANFFKAEAHKPISPPDTYQAAPDVAVKIAGEASPHIKASPRPGQQVRVLHAAKKAGSTQNLAHGPVHERALVSYAAGIPALERISFHRDASLEDFLAGVQNGVLRADNTRQFHYDPLAGNIPQRIAYLRSKVDWYRVSVQESSWKALDLPVQ
jgi:bacterioferritin-associated ferredoxin